MRSGAAFWTVSILLGVSLLVNVIALTRPARTEAKPTAASSAAARQAPAEEPTPAADEPAAAAVAQRPPRKAPAAAPGPAPAAPVRNDPGVEQVLAAQESFASFWREMDRLYRAKDRLDDEQFFEAVLTQSTHFLEIAEPARTRFEEASRTGVAAIQRARQDYDAGRRILPPKDKSNPAVYTAYKQQKDQIDSAYAAQVKAAVDGVKLLLDSGRPRHAEFSLRAERWLRNLVPLKARQP